MLHGTLELIERDAIANWWLDRLLVPPFPFPASPEAAAIRQAFENEGRQVHLLDLTRKWNVPVACAVAAGADGGKLGLGFGASLDPDHAAIRALRELMQARNNYRADPHPLPRGSLGYAAALWNFTATLAGDPHLVPQGKFAGRAAAPANFSGLVDQMEQEEAELCVLNLTRPEIGVPVVRMICPELLPPHYRLEERLMANANPVPFAL
jgi:ribosomal protein S12 methylthiotransferase accessory factor